MLLAAQKNSYNPVLRRLGLTKWDGADRIATFFIDWLGCEDNAYHRELATKWFMAGIARLYEPGHKFDLVPVLGGKQGGGKSGLIECLGMGFFGHLSGEFQDTKKMVESTRGKWILEVPELKGFHRGMIEDIKLYFSGTFDTVRLAYRENGDDFARRCIYMGTTNQDEYLRDDENRRFCPVLTLTHKGNKIKFDGPGGVKEIVPQLWAEAEHLYLEARKADPYGMLNLDFESVEARTEAVRLQTEAREVSAQEPVAEVIEDWLNKTYSASAVAANDDQVDEFDGEPGEEKFVRNYVTATLVIEALEQNAIIRDVKMNKQKVIGMALRAVPGWEYLGNVRRLGVKRRWFGRAHVDNRTNSTDYCSKGR